eukprot:scaffold10589_cov21-Tisochrysis_lutea.AAC.3
MLACLAQVFVFCCAHAEQITDYLSQSKWSRNKEMVVTPVVSTSCFSAGEALRLIDQKVGVRVVHQQAMQAVHGSEEHGGVVGLGRPGARSPEDAIEINFVLMDGDAAYNINLNLQI